MPEEPRAQLGSKPVGARSAWISVIAVIALALAAAVLSVVTSPASSGSGSAQEPAAALHQAVESTTGSRNFTELGLVNLGSECEPGGANLSSRLVYQAPDRIEQSVQDDGTFIAIGTIFYSNGGATTWDEEPLPTGETAGALAKAWLSPLLGRASVRRVGNTYISVIGPVSVPYGSEGYETYKGTIKTITNDGKVATEDVAGTLTNHGGPGISVPSPACGLLTYSAFGTSPPVVPPPAGDVFPGFG